MRGDLLRRHRLKAGLTQPDLARLAQISVRALRDIEQDRVSNPHSASLSRLADALSLSPAEREKLRAAKSVATWPALWVGVLGPLLVRINGNPVKLTSPALQRILGLLALEPNRHVPGEEVAELLWGSSPPPEWRNRIHAHINQLRQALEPNRVPRSQSSVLQLDTNGYRLSLPAGCLDATQFKTLIEQARQAANSPEAVKLYLSGLAGWRGNVLSGDDGNLAARPAVRALMRARLTATLELADAAARAEEHDQALVWLHTVADEEPLHEGVHSRLMVALAGTGQLDKALQLYRDLCARLVNELGVDPAPETQRVYRRLLEQSTVKVSYPNRIVRPSQLPMTTSLFAGRDDALSLLTGHFGGAVRPGEISAPRIVVLHGMPGVGKTSLALYTAHRIKELYPDGQLFADLYGERAEPARPAAILGGFLRALGVPPRDMPGDMHERSAILRSILAGKRLFMVLDDAHSAAQVLPLLPADTGNDVLITSRSPLVELPVTRHRLEPLTMNGSLAVLEQLLPEESRQESSAAALIAASCVGLPLALRVAAARVHDGATLGDVARTLEDGRQRVKELHIGQMAVQSSLESGYRALSPSAQAALRRVAVLPSRDFPHWAVEIALGLTRAEAGPVLAELVNAHLITPAGLSPRLDQHYSLHDLVKLFGAGRADDSDRDALKMVAVHYFHLAVRAANTISARLLPTSYLDIPPPLRLDDRELADPYIWFDLEYPILIDFLRHAVATGEIRLAAGLLNVIRPYLVTRDLLDELEECLHLTMAAAEESGDLHALAFAHDTAVKMHVYRISLSEAVPVAERGLSLFEQTRNAHGQAQMLYELQYLKRRLGDIAGAVAIASDLVIRYREIDDPMGEAWAYQALGMINREYLNDLGAARVHFEKALDLISAFSTRTEYAQIAYGLAFVYSKLGLMEEAEKLLQHSLAVMRAANERQGVVTCLNRLADIWPAQRARAALDEALSVAESIGNLELIAHVHQAFLRHHKRIGDTASAQNHAKAALDIYRRIKTDHHVNEMLKEIEGLTP